MEATKNNNSFSSIIYKISLLLSKFWNNSFIKFIRSNFLNLIMIFGIFIYNVMVISELKNYNVVLQFKIDFRSQLYYNLTEFFGNAQNTFIKFDFGIWNFGNWYYLIFLSILLIPAIFILLTIFFFKISKSSRSQYYIQHFHRISLVFILVELLVTMKITTNLEKLVGDLAVQIVNGFQTDFKFINDLYKYVSKGSVADITNIILLFPPLLVILAFGVMIYYFSKKNLYVTLLSLIFLAFIDAMGYWTHSIQTLGLVIVATIFCIITGVPIGILTAKSDTFYSLVRPILDFMQTIPSFVYLIPALLTYGLGVSSAIIASYIFAMPPAVRLTNLGIRQVPVQLIEVAESYGCTSWQKLVKVELPVAFPTIMAGINQVIMLTLSMVVIASLIGAPGLGADVNRALQSLKFGLGFTSGVAIVLIAIILDRVTGSRQED